MGAIFLGSSAAPSHELLHAPEQVFSSWPHLTSIFATPVAALLPVFVHRIFSKRRRERRFWVGKTGFAERGINRSFVHGSMSSTSSSDDGEFIDSDIDSNDGAICC